MPILARQAKPPTVPCVRRLLTAVRTSEAVITYSLWGWCKAILGSDQRRPPRLRGGNSPWLDYYKSTRHDPCFRFCQWVAVGFGRRLAAPIYSAVNIYSVSCTASKRFSGYAAMCCDTQKMLHNEQFGCTWYPSLEEKAEGIANLIC